MRAAVLAIVMSGLAAPAAAAPFATFNQGALARGFALPALGETQVLRAGDSQRRTTFDLTSEYVLEERGSEELLADGESMRLALQYRRGFGESLEWGMEVPLLRVSGGFMDSFIEDWHEGFGLPNGGREMAPQDRYRYRYVRRGTTVLDQSDTGTTLGDVLLLGGWRWRDGVALRGLVKLPTGDEERFTGGNAGAAAWADAALPFGDDSALSGFVSAGVSLNARGEVLGEQRQTVVPLGGAGVSWRVLQQVDLAAQANAHGPLYSDSELDALSRPGVQLVFGGSYHGSSARVDLAFQEDLVTRSSPDFSVQLAVTVY